MKHISKITQIIMTALLALSLSLQGIQPVAAQDGGDRDYARKAPTGNPPAQGTSPALADTTLLANPIQDPSFEAGHPNPYWTESSTSAYFGTPLCTFEAPLYCGNGEGTAGPRTGVVWGWFGGIAGRDSSSLSQTVVLDSGLPELLFYLWIGKADTGSDVNDVFKASIDGTPVFTANATQRLAYAKYKAVVVDISAFADGGSHTITFSSFTTRQIVTFNLDDVALIDSNSTSMTSRALEDGWVRESTEISNKGGAFNSIANMFYVGDDALNRQYRSVLSFDTTLPSGAVLVSATLRIKKAGLAGTNPFNSLGNLVVDIKPGALNENPALEKLDFQAPANKAAFNFGKRATDGWYSAYLASKKLAFINTSGITQFRLRFATDDNNNHVGDFLKFYSGDTLIPGTAPVLVITYYVP